MRIVQAIIGIGVLVASLGVAAASPVAGSEPVPSQPAPLEEPSPSSEPPSTGEAHIDVVVVIDPDGPGPKARRPAVDWTVSIWVTDADAEILDEARVRTGSDGRGTAIVQVAGPGLGADLEILYDDAYMSLGVSCVDVAIGDEVGSNAYEWVGFPLVAGGHYRCDFLAARATGGVGITAMYEADGRYNLMRGVDGDPGWTFDVTVRRGYASRDVLTTDEEGMAWTPVWRRDGARTVAVDIRVRLPAGYRIAEAGCSYVDRRADGVVAVPVPYQVTARGGRVSLTLDKWQVAQCLYVLVPSSVPLPETATAVLPVPRQRDAWPGGLLAWVAGCLAGWLALRRTAPRAPVRS